LRISTPIKGPSLAEVLAFTMIEDAADVARVERAARHRLRGVSEWEGWRVEAVDISEDADELARIKIYAKPVGPSLIEGKIFEFLTGHDNRRPSARFAAFLRAVGIVEKIEDDRELQGRYFAILNDGRTAADFGPLTKALL